MFFAEKEVTEDEKNNDWMHADGSVFAGCTGICG